MIGDSVYSLGRSLTPFPWPLPRAELATHESYALMRQPIYLGILLALLGFLLLMHSPLRLLATSITAVFLDRKASRE